MPVKVKTSWRGGQFLVKTKAAASEGASAAADLLIAEAKRLILNTPKTGRLYGNHQASAPGEPPANLTGHLVASFKKVQSTTGSVVSVRVTNTAKYAMFLEFGTRKMAARPFMRPAYTNVKDQMLRLIEQKFREGLK